MRGERPVRAPAGGFGLLAAVRRLRALSARRRGRRSRHGIWSVLESFASFGFCKAHAAAFALPTYQSAWLKTHHPAHFLSGVLTHDPGMYPKRLMLKEARRLGVQVLGPDVNRSVACYRVEKLDGPRRSRRRTPGCRTAAATASGWRWPT